MDERLKKHSILLNFSIINSVISSLSLMATILVNTDGKNQMILVLFAIIFWLGLIAEQISIWRANAMLKEIEKQSRRKLRGRYGIFSVATSIEGLIADGVFAISIIGLIICVIFHLGETLMQYVFICLMVLSFRMHCFLNGKNYRYKKLLERKVDRKNG